MSGGGRAGEAAPPDRSDSSPGTRLGLAAAVGVALAGGLIRLGHPGLWCDEIYTARWTGLSLSGLMQALGTDLHPPLYFVLERWLVRALGEGEFALRLLSVVAAAAAVALSCWAFRPALGPRRALLAAWLVALAPQFFIYARMARYFSLAAFVAMLAHGVFVRGVGARSRARDRALYSLAVALLLYTSYLAACLVIAHGVWAWLEDRGGRVTRGWLLSTAAAALVFAPWVVVLLRQLGTAQALIPALHTGPRGLALMLGYEAYAFTASELVYPWHPLGAAALIAGGWLLARGCVTAARERLARALLVPALVTLALAALAVSGLAHATPFVSLPARTLFLWPFAAVLMAAGLPDHTSRGAWRWTPVVVLGAAWALAWVHLERAQDYLNPIYLTPGREVARDLVRDARPGDLVLSEDDTGANYYLERLGYAGAVVDPVDTLAVARALERQPRRIVWVRLARDGSERVRSSAGTRGRLAPIAVAVGRSGYLAYPPAMRAVRHRLLGLEDHAFRVTVERLRAVSP